MRKKLHHHFHEYLPFYDDNADYNTNSKSYYDYLARYNKFLKSLTDSTNRLLSRDILVEDTKSIDLEKIGTWLEDLENCIKYDDEITLKANVIISKMERIFKNNDFTTSLKNGTEVMNDGVYSPDFTPVLEKLFNDIKSLNGDINNINNLLDSINNNLDLLENLINGLNNRIITLENALQKIIDNLHAGGAINSKNINTFNFVTGRNIASGNINLFGGTSDGNTFIRTSNSNKENDITAGY